MTREGVTLKKPDGNVYDRKLQSVSREQRLTMNRVRVNFYSVSKGAVTNNGV